jgi:beta-lactamase regulating signal transducer with metallopeptidase domain
MMLAALLRASIDGAIVVGILWAAARALRGLTPTTRAAIWWCGAAKFIVALLWITPIAIPVLPAAGETFGLKATTEPATLLRGAPTVASADGIARTSGAASASRRKVTPALTATTALLSAWVIGVFGAILIAARRWRQMTGTIERATCAPIEVQSMTADLARRLRLRRVPQVRVSDEIDTPLVTGLLSSTILVPAGRFQMLSGRQQEMAICHELAHIARGDLWFGCVPAVVERLFFFHPLAHVAAREYGFWREAACDATVIDVLEAAPQEYGRLLLNLGVARPRTNLAAAGASWSFSNLKRRIVMLNPHSRRTFGSRLLTAATLAAATAVLAPLQLVARPSSVGERAEPAEPSPAATSLDSEAAPAPSPTAPPEQARETERQEPRLNYVLFLGDDRTMMSGSSGDTERARRFKGRGERILWFRDGSREYVVRDPSALREVEELWKEVSALGEQQGRLGAEQGKLGAKQGEIGAKQGLIGAEQGRLGARQGELGQRQGQLAARQGQRLTAAEQRELEKDQREIDLQMRELDREMQALGEKMRELGKPMENLGAEMAVLGQEMERLGRQMEAEGRKAETGMRVLLRQLISNGLAEPAK